MWFNGFKEDLEYFDYIFDEYFGKVILFYLFWEVFYDYLKGRDFLVNYYSFIYYFFIGWVVFKDYYIYINKRFVLISLCCEKMIKISL